jgi:hypothetical protein
MLPTRATAVAPAFRIGAAALGCAAIACVASGCAATNLEKSAAFNKASREAVVIVAAPEHSTLWLYEGVDDGVNRTCGAFFKPAARLFPEGGFAVAKLPPRTGDQMYAIAEMAPGPEASRGLRPAPNVKSPVRSRSWAGSACSASVGASTSSPTRP